MGIVFTAGGSFAETFEMLAGQSRKAMFSLNKCLHKFTEISPKHYLDLFDKLLKPVLQYGSEVWGFSNANLLERVHLQICKQVLGAKRATQNDFIYWKLGRLDLKSGRLVTIIKYWFKIILCENTNILNVHIR